MKIAFYSEVGTPMGNKYPANYQNMRTDVAWAVALDATVYDFSMPASNTPQNDLGIIIVPKKHPQKAINFHNDNKYICERWAIMQEGPNNLWQDWEVPTQIEYIQLLHDVDFVFCHNEFDKLYYNGLLNTAKSFVLRSLFISEAIPQNLKIMQPKRNGAVINGNWVSWYGAQDSFFIAQEFGERIYAPSMGRKQEYEDYLEDINYFPYMDWSTWMARLNEMRYGVNLMRTFAAGTFSLNCAILGIPCIGWNYMDTQQICFPELTVDVGNMQEARRIARHLKNNKLFYDHVSAYAQKTAIAEFGKEMFLKRFLEFWTNATSN
jgi:hypothetical protein